MRIFVPAILKRSVGITSVLVLPLGLIGLGQSVPTLSSSLATLTVCSGHHISYTPQSTNPNVGFTWSRAAVPGISNAAGTGIGTFYETLINTTALPITVTYVYTLTAGTVTNTQNIYVVVNPEPVVSFTVNSPTQCVGGNSFVFTNTSTIGTGALTYLWTLGDGDSSTQTDVTHSYSSDGGFSVKLSATSIAGCATSTAQTMVVNEAPVVNFTYAITNPATNGYYFNGQAVAGSTTISNYSWAFGDGGNATIQQPTHTYTTSGSYTVTLTATTAQGCSGSASQILTTNSNPAVKADFTINNSAQCLNNAFTFTDASFAVAPNSLSSFAWNFGDGTTTTGANVQHTYVDAGNYVVSETVSLSNGTVQTVTQSIIAYPVIDSLTFIPTTNLVVCPGSQSMPLYFGPQHEGIRFSWTTSAPGTGAPATGAGDFLPSFTATNATASPVTANILVKGTTSYGCGTGTGTIMVTVNPTPQITSALPNQTVCNGTPFNGYTFQTNLTGSTYFWTNTDPVIGLTQIGITNIPSFTGSTHATSPETGTVTLIATNNGCTSSKIFTLTVKPSPNLDTAVAPATICSGTVFNYTPTGTPGGITYTWTRLAQSDILQPTTSGTGPIAETLTDTSSVPVAVPYAFSLMAPNGCVNTEQIVDTVNPSPTAELIPDTTAQAVCTGLISNAVAITSPVAGTSFTWTNSNPAVGLPASGTGNIPSFLATDAGNTAISGTVQISAITATGCAMVAPVTFTITINPLAPASLATPDGTILCPGDSLPIVASGGYTYQWYGNGSSQTGATSPLYNAKLPGTYNVTSITNMGCRDSSSIPIVIVVPTVTVGFTSQPAICINLPLTYTNTSVVAEGQPLAYQWYDNAGNSSTATSPVFTYDSAGIINVTLVATPVGCASLTDSITEQITVLAPAPGIQLPTVNLELGLATQLNARPLGDSSVTWNPPTGLSSTTIANPIATLTTSEQYTITMINTAGCSTTDTLQILIRPRNTVYIPSGFTPNGDGFNDLFVITGINNYPGSSLAVYNRWGKQVYYAASYQNNWGGSDLPAGTYVYVLQLKTTQGYTLYKGALELMR
jgi:gliding motility-associated-like protein